MAWDMQAAIIAPIDSAYVTSGDSADDVRNQDQNRPCPGLRQPSVTLGARTELAAFAASLP
jgi:hypothetical protein